MVIRKSEVNGDKLLKYPYIYLTSYIAAAQTLTPRAHKWNRTKCSYERLKKSEALICASISKRLRETSSGRVQRNCNEKAHHNFELEILPGHTS